MFDFDDSTSLIHQSGMCDSLHKAVITIETTNELRELHQRLFANITTFFHCGHCHQIPDSLSSPINKIFVYMKACDSTSRLAFPIMSGTEIVNTEQQCSFCNYKPSDRILKIEMQICDTCPKVAMSILDSDIDTSNLFDYEMHLIDAKNNKYQYRTKSLLFISKYSNNITLLRRDNGSRYVAHGENPYSRGIFIGDSEVMNLYHTASNVLIFSNQVSE